MSTVANNRSAEEQKGVLLEAAKYLPVPFLVLLFSLILHFNVNVESELSVLKHRELQSIGLSSKILSSRTDTFISDTRFLLASIERFVADGMSDEVSLRIQQEFLAFSKTHSRYHQIRLLDVAGQEIIRVNNSDGAPAIVSADLLQNKESRYYFKEMQQLSAEQIYISPLDLNIEHDRIDQPYQATIRFGVSLHDDASNKLAYLIINISANDLINSFLTAAENTADRIMLLNQQGYWLISPNENDNWGFLVDQSKSFADRYRPLWDKIKLSEQGQFDSHNGLITHATARPFSRLSFDKGEQLHAPYYWRVVSIISNDQLDAIGIEFLRLHAVLYGLILIFGSLAAFVIAYYRSRLKISQIHREYEIHFRDILQDVKLIAVSLDSRGRISFCNDYFLEKVQHLKNDVIGQNWFHVFIPADVQDDEFKLYKTAFETGMAPQPFRGLLKTQRGSVRSIDWSSTLSNMNSRQSQRLTLIGKDVTEQILAEEELRKLNRAVEQSPNTVMICNAKGEIEYVNPTFTKLTGYSVDEVIGRNPRFLKSGETPGREYKALWDTITEGKDWQGIFHNRKKNGELYWEATTISPVRNSDGEITHYLAIKEDLTDRKRLEQEAEDSEKEVTQNRELAFVGRLANMIAHDLRNPLSSVKMTLQMMNKSNHESQVQELLQISLEQVRYMENMITDLLIYSHPLALKAEWLNVDKILDTAISVSQLEINRHDVVVEVDYQPGLPTIHGDRTMLVRAFSNLINNGVQATENLEGISPRITIRAFLHLSDDGPKVQIDIRDNGKGIDPGEIDQLYVPFFTTRSKGTGLGLSIVKRVINQHSGSIHIETEEGLGVKVKILLPTGPLPNQTVNSVMDADQSPMENSLNQLSRPQESVPVKDTDLVLKANTNLLSNLSTMTTGDEDRR